MIRKTALALVALLAISTAEVMPARADVDININLGYGGWGVIGINRGSCAQGARIVARRFNGVVARDCRGSRYQYTARRNGKFYIITVNAYNGRIIGIRRWWR